MINLNNVKTLVIKSLGRSGLVLSKYSPEILLGVGIAGVIASTVLACKATLKVDAIMSAADVNIHHIKDVREQVKNGSSVEYSEKDATKDILTVHVQKTVELAKLYAPAILIGTFSIGCIVGGHNILSRRNVALMAAYKLVDEGYKKYRKQLIERFGEDVDNEFRFGSKEDEPALEVVDEATGEKKVIPGKKVSHDAENEYARWFEYPNPRWRNDYTYNLFFLQTTQNEANDILHGRGHIFLNEVYQMLGIDHSKAGAIVGWVNNGTGDNLVDFGLVGPQLYRGDRQRQPYFPIRNAEGGIHLDFNVDGVIYDLI